MSDAPELTYEERLEQMVDRGDSRQDIKAFMEKHNESVLDLDTAFPKNVTHRWVDRGVVLSCEGAGHQNHRHFKRR